MSKKSEARERFKEMIAKKNDKKKGGKKGIVDCKCTKKDKDNCKCKKGGGKCKCKK